MKSCCLILKLKKHWGKIMLVPPVSAACGRIVFLCLVSMYFCAIVILQRKIPLPNTSWPTRKVTGSNILLNLDLNFFATWPRVGLLARKSRLVMNWYSFLGREYSFFNANAKVFNCLKDIEKPKSFLGLYSWNPTKALP